MPTFYETGMKTISGHQSSYLPWYGFFEKMYKSDLFAIHDTAQFEKKDFSTATESKRRRAPDG